MIFNSLEASHGAFFIPFRNWHGLCNFETAA
jgi:hypothetical protein